MILMVIMRDSRILIINKLKIQIMQTQKEVEELNRIKAWKKIRRVILNLSNNDY